MLTEREMNFFEQVIASEWTSNCVAPSTPISFLRSLVRPFVSPFVRSFIHSFIAAFVYLFIYLFILFISTVGYILGWLAKAREKD